MSRWHTIIFFAGLLTHSLTTFCQEKDSVFLFNGQVLIGDIKSGQLGEITIDDVDLRIVELKQYKIKRLTSHRRFKVQTQSKEIFFGIMHAGSRDGTVRLQLDGGEDMELTIMDISTVVALEKKFFQRLTGNLSGGFSYTKSSDLGQINFSSNTYYVGERFEHQLSFNMIASIDSGKFSRDREDAGLFSAYNFKSTWFVAGALYYQRNLELSIARRYQQLIGAGNKLFVRRYWQLLILSGMTFNEEKSTSGTASKLLLEVPLNMRFNFFRYRRPNIQVNFTQSGYFSLSEAGRWRYDSNLSFSWEIFHQFYFTFNPYGSYDSKPPEGNSNSDFGVAVSISFKY
jgi:hypothetical protein